MERPCRRVASPGSYLTLNRTWKEGDRVEVRLPMSLRMETLPGDNTQQAAMYGPLVLAGTAGRARALRKQMFYSEYSTTPPGDALPVPAIATSSQGSAGLD